MACAGGWEGDDPADAGLAASVSCALVPGWVETGVDGARAGKGLAALYDCGRWRRCNQTASGKSKCGRSFMVGGWTADRIWEGDRPDGEGRGFAPSGDIGPEDRHGHGGARVGGFVQSAVVAEWTVYRSALSRSAAVDAV